MRIGIPAVTVVIGAATTIALNGTTVSPAEKRDAAEWSVRCAEKFIDMRYAVKVVCSCGLVLRG